MENNPKRAAIAGAEETYDAIWKAFRPVIAAAQMFEGDAAVEWLDDIRRFAQAGHADLGNLLKGDCLVGLFDVETDLIRARAWVGGIALLAGVAAVDRDRRNQAVEAMLTMVYEARDRFSDVEARLAQFEASQPQTVEV